MARPLVSLSSAALIVLSGCARADPPEMFEADPALLNDFTASLPSHGRTGAYQYEIIQGLAIFEGDILLGEVDSTGSIPRTTSARGLAREDAFGRWPDGIVPYIPPTSNSGTQQINIRQAIDHWMEHSRITFVERTEENADQYPHYLRFASSNGCASYVGMQGGEQSIMVSDGCTPGSIIHEIGHALGLFHEHTRSDRDSYVQINWDEIVDGKDINFQLQNVGTRNYGDYDYGSIMHYGEYFFSAGTTPTIVVPDGVTIGQRVALSDIDARSVDQMYATDLALLPPSDIETSEGLELGITVLNQGNLGASEVQLVVKLADDTEWLGVSGDGSWDCKNYSSELRCTRPTLTEKTESRFTILADAGSGNADDVSILLTSRTLDTNEDNNRYNDDGALSEEPVDNDARSIANTTDEQESVDEPTGETVISIPAVAAAQSQSFASNDASAGGSDNGSLFLMMLSLIGWRACRTTRRQ
ncbi:M12 family metallopeptidase [Granulosicoccus sp. 3-233]|uniref:M12 family metallopeptidase n=1 Tax=Granulosicoccus sp. 3-233 TaxID=3417969 RepID=UPI003D32875F